ncbi:MAG: RNA polymerase subunit sigma-70 [Planctomycetota bacterium]|nr:MAG: RNA polymerase subunit sigma-70 [Planctomycetota bacterium]REJ97512.1 MAG: RNA polymerase subunit sigma-70 [Planctomycetota bacterium]REK21004.1 MAG: RNA polymerase subunit sigma-70 [Planctomycetota bacterium]REK37337.1 MAG: RNA polymerase subunit sigma-70 [Planctomycetota bacterium]
MIRLQSGDGDAFTLLVERHQGPLTGFFVRNTRDVQLAEDLTQETLLKVYNQAWDYLPLGQFRAWMYRIARNLLIDDYRRRSHDALIRASKGRKEEDEDAMARLAGDFAAPGDLVQRRELAALVDRLLAEIPEEQRITFTLHHYADLRLAEVAQIMEIPVATCKSRLRLAREKLSEKLRARGLQPVGQD